MAQITRNPRPPYRVVEECLGHAFNYATYWSVADANGDYPIDLLPGSMSEGLAWCVREVARLNKESGDEDEDGR